MKGSQQLVSHDIHNNKYQYKHTFSVEISPISKVILHTWGVLLSFHEYSSPRLPSRYDVFRVDPSVRNILTGKHYKAAVLRIFGRG